jgi:hypothetical protein
VERHVPTVADIVRRAVAICDPAGEDSALTSFERQLEDDDEPASAVQNLEERLALAAEGADYDVDDAAVSLATAVVLYLAGNPDASSYDRDPGELVRLAVRVQWRGDPPDHVSEWLADAGLGE